ncbi:MAG: hypothetical protein DRO40_04470 [Thermoprotei archaeon]|nr:MAG: hypothetical protein DRO40_04470 [Thermoprotei archaeon]
MKILMEQPIYKDDAIVQPVNIIDDVGIVWKGYAVCNMNYSMPINVSEVMNLVLNVIADARSGKNGFRLYVSDKFKIEVRFRNNDSFINASTIELIIRENNESNKKLYSLILEPSL